MKRINYFDEDLYGTWQNIHDTKAITNVYRGFDQLDWTDCFFAINFVNNVKQIETIRKFKKVILSCHFQTFEVDPLFHLLDQHQDQEFLFLIDQNINIQNYKNLNEVFPNVTLLPWITWHHQLQSAIEWHGIANDIKPSAKKISCVSGRHDIHKSIIIAYLLKEFDKNDYVCSSGRNIMGNAYWLTDDFYLPDRLRSLLQDYYHLDITPSLDNIVKFQDQPILTVTNWNYPTFTESCINLPLESQFNDVTLYQGQQVRIPGPMFTEKTWKPLLAGQSFLPVGQFHSCQSLQKYGINFDFGVDLEFDKAVNEFTRLEKLLSSLDQIKKMSLEELRHKSMINAKNNLQTIKSGTFFNLCEQHNQQILPLIGKWINQ